MRRRGRKRFVILAIILGLLIALAGIAWRLMWIEPQWYDPPSALDQRVLQLADQAEYRLVEETQKVRPAAEAWAVRIRQEQINAWLAARLPQWIAHEAKFDWPAELGTPQVRLTPAGIDLAVPLMHDGASRTVVVRIKPELLDGRLKLGLTKLSIGILPLPGDPLATLLDKLAEAMPERMDDPALQQAIEILSGRRTIDPVIDLADGRRLRLLDVMLHPGAFDVMAQTLDGAAERTPATQQGE